MCLCVGACCMIKHAHLMLLVAAGTTQALLMSDLLLRRVLMLFVPSRREPLQRYAAVVGFCRDAADSDGAFAGGGERAEHSEQVLGDDSILLPVVCCSCEHVE